MFLNLSRDTTLEMKEKCPHACSPFLALSVGRKSVLNSPKTTNNKGQQGGGKQRTKGQHDATGEGEQEEGRGKRWKEEEERGRKKGKHSPLERKPFKVVIMEEEFLFGGKIKPSETKITHPFISSSVETKSVLNKPKPKEKGRTGREKGGEGAHNTNFSKKHQHNAMW